MDYLKEDRFRQFLGAEIVEFRDGYARVEGVVREEFTNFHGTAHGSYIIALADFALGIAANADGTRRFAISIHVDFHKPANVGDKLVAIAERAGGGRRVVFYELKVLKDGEVIAMGNAIVYGRSR
jgi:acyl-CoA thioesterase